MKKRNIILQMKKQLDMRLEFMTSRQISYIIIGQAFNITKIHPKMENLK